MSEQQQAAESIAQNVAAERERKALVEMRAQLTAFLDSPAGLLLRERAESEKDAALHELARVAPTDSERIRALQATVARVDGFTDWLFDLLYAGDQAADGTGPDDAD